MQTADSTDPGDVPAVFSKIKIQRADRSVIESRDEMGDRKERRDHDLHADRTARSRRSAS
jgi:hypothetical protein